MSKFNPYPDREHGVGELRYNPKEVNVNLIRALFSVASYGSKLAFPYGEKEFLYDLPRLVGGGNLANLGHAKGYSALIMAKGLHDNVLDGKVYSVDAFNGKRNLYNRAIKSIQLHSNSTGIKFEDRIKIYMGLTEVCGNLFKEQGIRFSGIFVDADHLYEAVKMDYEVWSPMLKVGGLMFFHDTNQEDTHRVLRECLFDNSAWKERTELHINRIRCFERGKE